MKNLLSNNPSLSKLLTIKTLILVGLAFITICIGAYFALKDTTEVAIPKAKSDWSESSSKGGLNQGQSYFAVSARTSPVHQLDFPYHEITVSLGFGCDASDEWIYAAFSEAPNIANAQTEEEFNLYVTAIKFDNHVEEYVMTQKFGARFFHFKNDDQIAAKITDSSSMTLQLDWYKEGIVRFDFSLAGSNEVIERARKKCARL